MKLLCKELRLCASPLSYLFILGGLLAFAPGYPVLMGAFFPTLGIFYSFQTMRENGDIQYSLLLPVAKGDIVKGKFAFAMFIEGCSFVLLSGVTLVRMVWMSGAEAYVTNALMCANLSFLGLAMLLFGLFNFVFIAGFFKTAYFFAKPFVLYLIFALAFIALGETLHHLPGLEAINAFGFWDLSLQLPVLCVGMVGFALLTALGMKKSIRSFERVDL